MARIIPLPGGAHQETQELLPWYATDGLEPAERARVDAHLAVCADCREELALEKRLAPQMAGLPIDAEHGWAQMRRRMQQPPRSSPARPSPRRGGGWLAWAVAAQVLVVAGVGGFVLSERTPRYQTLGAATPPPAGDVVVMFRPDTPERDLRRLLQANGARLVDGPTAADAYVLRTPAGRRAATLAALRASPEVALAQPLGAPGPQR
jgi:hypothetical protein